MIISNSSDITVLLVQVNFDISSTSPQIILTNLSQGPNLAGVSWAFVAQSPLPNTFIHDGDINTPDIVGTWSSHTLTDNWPKNPFNPKQVIFSGAPYSFYVIAKDSNGNVYQTPPQTVSICHPSGNLPTTQSNFGQGTVAVQVLCQQARIFFQDKTQTSYQGIDGTEQTSILNVRFPMDNTGVAAPDFVGADFVSALVPISFSANGYQFLYRSKWLYDFGNDTFVTLQYLQNAEFPVLCNIDLSVLTCEVEKLAQQIADGTCANQQEAQNKMNLITPKLFLVFMGIFQPLSVGNQNVYELIEEIKTIGGFECDCCNVASGIIPDTSSIIDGYNFTINPVCGDISGSVTVNGSNIIFNLQDKSYIFKMCADSPEETTAFTVVKTVDDCAVTYCLNVDVTQLATDILNTIKDDVTLVNLFNSIVINNGGSFNLIVDGKCIFSSGTSCDYTFTLVGVPADTTFALMENITVNSVATVLNFAFNLTNLPALQTYLNGLGIGTFVVSNVEGSVLITSAANTNNLQTLIYSPDGVTDSIAAMTKDCSGFVAISANQVVQNIIDYICALDDSQVKTSAEYTICYLDPVTGESKTEVVAEGTALTTFITDLLAKGCNTITYISSLPQLNCAGVSSLFPSNITPLQLSDVVYGKKSGVCSEITIQEIIQRGLELGYFDQAIVTAVCNIVGLCAGGQPCTNYSEFSLTVVPDSPNIDISVALANSDPNYIGSNLRYARIDNTGSPTYTYVFNVVTNPYVITDVPDGQYRVFVQPLFNDGRICPEQMLETPPCTGITSFNVTLSEGTFVVTYTVEEGLLVVKVNIQYPNGGFFSNTYEATGDPINITVPTDVYGDYIFTIQPVCNDGSGFVGVASSPAFVNVPNPPNDVFTNNTGDALTNISFVANNGGSQLIFTNSNLANAGTVNFFIADGSYTTIVVNFTGSVAAASLVTGTGTYAGVISGGTITFTAVTMSGGGTVTLT